MSNETPTGGFWGSLHVPPNRRKTKPAREDGYLTVAESADYLRLSIRTFRRRIPQIRHYRIGRRLVFRKADLDQWIERFEVSPRQARSLDTLVDDVVAEVLGN